MPRRVNIGDKTRKLLWAHSGSICAICQRGLFEPGTPTDDPAILGIEAHIIPWAPQGPRAHGWPGTTEAQRNSYDNIIILCPTCHTLIDAQPNTYTIDDLRRIKREHAVRIERLRELNRQSSEQAEKVTAWPSVVRSNPADPQSEPAWGATVRNVSDLPVYQLGLEYRSIQPARGVRTVIAEVIPPGDWNFSGRRIFRAPDGAATDPRAWDLPERSYTVELRFTDINGAIWRRDRNGILQPATHQR